VWFGDAAASLGLRGVVDDAAFVHVIGGLDPTGVFVLGRRHGDESVRGQQNWATGYPRRPRSTGVANH
jgi:hypothetical protein